MAQIMKNYIHGIVLISFLLPFILAHDRAPPGINPQQYQNQPHHQQQLHQQQQHQQTQQQQHQQQQQYQRTAPGVPPSQYDQQQQQYQPPPPPPQQQQYQQPPQQQHQQPQQPQYQQPPQQQQYQQPPQQQQYQQAPQQQQVHQQPSAHGHQPHQQQRVLHNNNIKDEREHIKEHLEVPLDTSGMSEEELQYHYFKMHDADNNNRLDGQELIKSLFHWHDSNNHDPAKTAEAHAPPEPKIFTDEELVAMIDPIMDQDDGNRDGFIDYAEFVKAQQKAASNAASTAAAAGTSQH